MLTAMQIVLACLTGAPVDPSGGVGLQAAGAEPTVTDSGVVFPEGYAPPRSMTEAERGFLAHNPNYFATRAEPVTAPPSGPIHCAAEYEPMDGICLSWWGSSGQTAIIASMAAGITTTGNADVWLHVASGSTQTTALNTISAAGANMARVHTVNITCDSIWIRDYGPRYIFEGNCRAIVDHQYNRVRPNDDAEPTSFGNTRHHQRYAVGVSSTELIHGGGNFHLDALNRSYSTKLTLNENPTLTQAQIHDAWGAFQGVDHWFFDPFPTSIDSTQHLDMWMQVIGDNKVVISDWPLNSGSTQDVICDNAATFMASRGYSVYRVPAFSVGGTHYTYCNVVICNNLLLLPTYTNSTVTNYSGGLNGNTVALGVWQTALPGYTIKQVPCQSIVTLAGVMHCIAMHIPQAKGLPGAAGGLAPTAYLKTYRTSQTLTPGQQISLNYITDDDVGVSSVDVLYSLDDGASYPNTVATGLSPLGSASFTVPSVCTSHLRFRVVAKDALGNQGTDDSVSSLTINGPLPGDTNGDHVVNTTDLGQVLTSFGASVPAGTSGDLNGDGVVNSTDLGILLSSFGSAC